MSSRFLTANSSINCHMNVATETGNQNLLCCCCVDLYPPAEPKERRQRPSDEHQMTNKNRVQGWNKKPERHLVSIQLWRQDMIS